MLDGLTQKTHIALLIDCDNASSAAIEGVLNELAKYGVVNIRRAYGNWKNPFIRGWEEKLHEYAIKPIQQFSYTDGKNATDAAMIIDAMDLLYTQNLDAFGLVTSDSDFTPLVMRILTNGLKVYGFGERKTPLPFVNACSQFIYTDGLVERDPTRENGSAAEHVASKQRRTQLRCNTSLVNLLRKAAEAAADEDGWAHLGRVGQHISNNTSFSPLNYGYNRLSDLIVASDLFEIKRGNKTQIYIKDKRKTKMPIG